MSGTRKLASIKKQAGLIESNLVSLILIIVIAFAILGGCSRMCSQNNRGFSEFPELLNEIDSTPENRVMKTYIAYLDEDAAIVFFNKWYTQININLFGEEFVLERPPDLNCEDGKACLCYLGGYDDKEKKFEKYSCEGKNLNIVWSPFIPLEILTKSDDRTCTKVYRNRDCNQLKGLSDYEAAESVGIYNIEGFKITGVDEGVPAMDRELERLELPDIPGVVIDRGITNAYSKGDITLRWFKHEDNLVICHDYEVCKNMRDYFDEKADGQTEIELTELERNIPP